MTMLADELDPPPRFDTLALLFSHYTIITKLSEEITTGDLIQLSRTSSTIRETLLQSREHWERLVGLTKLECTEKGHKKGEKIKGCKICSIPVCETCIVRADFFGQNGTYSNRIRTFCDTCWSATNFSDAEPTAPILCECVAKDGWLCSSCRAIERSELIYNEGTCATDGCDNPHNSSEKHRVCTWCQRPLPTATTWRPTGEVGILARHVFNEDRTGEMYLQADDDDDSMGEEVAGGSAFPTEDGGGRGRRSLRKAKSTDKIAGWDQEDEDTKARYKEAWLKKGAREREMDREHGGEGSSGSKLKGRKYSVGDGSEVDDDRDSGREEDDEEEHGQGPSGDGTSAPMDGPPPYSEP
ncbi:hypothetical protein L873DRAFT_1012839 [Choiromyces venosus 120613-1]|uniref:Uncharacterized protein n=1 Tax=Choiromyces venosus 120613-1 TaxID=1336337 RepID=A0A3N4JJY4_9PEZI|nr:hypothetical protein L873DRAFT_1012839 [Choiromyces venosus 120613-1]